MIRNEDFWEGGFGVNTYFYNELINFEGQISDIIHYYMNKSLFKVNKARQIDMF